MATPHKRPSSKFRSVKSRNNNNNKGDHDFQQPIARKYQGRTVSSSHIPTAKLHLKINKSDSLPGRNNNTHKRSPSQSVMVRLKRLDTLRLNERIKVRDYGYGTIKFLGCVHFAQGLFVGVELDNPNGKHDGSYHGKRYFSAPQNHGVLVKQHKVELLDVVDNRHYSATNSDDYGDLIGNMSGFNGLFGANNDDFMMDDGKYNNDAIDLMMDDDILNMKKANELIKEQIDKYKETTSDLKTKIGGLEMQNEKIKLEKSTFETEMNDQIEKLSDELISIRSQLKTKDNVLKKQMSMHDAKKKQFREKIKEYSDLQVFNGETVELIKSGEMLKDEIIAQMIRNDKNYHNMIENDYKMEIQRCKQETDKKINCDIHEWLFDNCDDIAIEI